MTNQPTLKDYARRMRTLVEGQSQYAGDLRELAKEMRETGFQAAALKAWVKAMISFESGDEGPIDRLKARTADVALYGGILGFAVDGFGEPNRLVINESPQGDGDGERVYATQALGGQVEGEPSQYSARCESANEILASPTNQKAAPALKHSPDTSDGDPTRKDGYSGAAPIPETAAPEAAAVPPGDDSDIVAVSDSPVSLPDPTLDGEGAGGTDPFEIPHFLRRIPQV